MIKRIKCYQIVCLALMYLAIGLSAPKSIYAVTQVAETSDTTTTSTSDVVVTGITTTPGAGDYHIFFTTSVEGSSSSSRQFVSIYHDGTQVAHTEREIFTEGSIPNTPFQVAIYAEIIGVLDSEAIDIRWRTTAGTATMHEKTFLVIPIIDADSTQVSATANTTTTSTSDTLLTGMSVTPGAGDYLVWFSGSLEGTDSNSDQFVSLYANGVQVAHTEREMLSESSARNTSFPISTHSLVTGLGAGQTLETQWRTSAGTATMHERTMVVLAVDSTNISQVTATANDTTTSNSDVLVNSMTVTPGAGDYHVWFSSSLLCTTDSAVQHISIYVGGVQVAHTERENLQEASLNPPGTDFPIATHARITDVGAADAVEIRWRTSAGTATMHERTLTLMEVVDVSGTSNSTGTIKAAVNGNLLAATGTIASSNWTITGIPKPDTSDVITAWIDGAAVADESTAVTKYDGTGDITGMVLDQHILSIGSDDNQSLVFSDLGLYDNDDDEDILYSSNNGILTVDANEIYTDDQIDIKLGNALTVGATEMLKVHDVDNNGTLTTTGTLFVEGSWDNAAAAVFTQSSGRVVFSGTMSETIVSNGYSFTDVHINDGLMGYWRLDESSSISRDFSGYGHYGTWGGTPTTTTDVSGTTNFANSGALLFNASSDYVDAGDLDALDNVSQFTMSAWMRRGALSAWNGLSKNSGSNTRRVHLIQWNNGRVYINVSNGSNAFGYVSINDTLWHHYTFVYDGTQVGNAARALLYIDGVQQTLNFTSTIPATTADHTSNFYIGRAYQGGYQTTNGYVDDVRVYNRPLAASEVARLAAGNTPALTGGTYSLQDNLDVNGTLSIHGGTLDVNGNDITVSGNWLNTGGVFDPETRNVTLDGGDQAIDYSGTFSNLSKVVTMTGSLTIGQGATITVDGALTLSGASGNLLGIESSTAGTRHIWDVTAGDQNTSYLNVKDSESSTNDIVAVFSTNVGNNDDGGSSPHWIFALDRYWVGSVGGNTSSIANWSAFENACGVGGGASVPNAENTAIFSNSCVNNSSVDSLFNVGGMLIESGHTGIITPNALIDVDGPMTMEDGTIDFSSNNTDTNILGNVTISGGTVTSGTGTLTLDGILIYNDTNSTNFGHVYIGTLAHEVTLFSDFLASQLTIVSGNKLITNGYDLDINGTFDINGTLDAINGVGGNTVINVLGTWDMTSGSFFNTNSHVIFDGTSGNVNIFSDGESFNDITIDDGGGGSLIVELEDALDVNGSLIIQDGTIDAKAGENNAISIAKNWDNNDVFLARSGTVTFDGTTSQTVSGGASNFYILDISNVLDAVTFDEAFTTTNFTNTTPGSMLRFQQSTTFTITGDLIITGTVGNEIDIDSVDSSTQFTFDVTGGGQTVTRVRVENSTASSNNIYAVNSTNDGGNDDADPEPRWVFQAMQAYQIHYRWRNDDDVEGQTSSQVTATADDTRILSSYGQIDSMSITPGAGDYLAFFSSTIEGTSGGSVQLVSLFVNGVQQTHTERQVDTEGSFPNMPFPIATHSELTGVGAGQAIDVRFSTSSGTATVHERTLTVIPIDPTDTTQVTATANDTTTSTTYDSIVSMSITPGAGDYFVFFSSSIEGSSSSSTQRVSIFENGSQVTHSERQSVTEGSESNVAKPIATHAKITGLGAGQAIDVRFRTSAGTATIYERTLTVVAITDADSTQVTATANDTTTSSSYGVVSGMTVTPGAGSYLTWFSSSISGNNDSSTQDVSIFDNGSQVSHTERESLDEGSCDSPNCSVNIMNHAFISGVEAAEDLDVRWKTSGGTATMHERTWLVSNDIAPVGAAFAVAEDTQLTNLLRNTTQRLRFQVSNEGATSTAATKYRLEVSEANPTACSAGTYTRVDSSTHWDVVSSTQLADGEATYNITPGLTDEGTTFVSGELKEASDETGDITLTPGDFTEIEFALQATGTAARGANYCFRLTDQGTTGLFVYNIYAEVQISNAGPLKGPIMVVD